MGRALLLIGTVAYLLHGSTALAWVPYYTARPQATIPVRLHASLQLELRHTDGTTWTRSELEQAVRTTLTRLNQSNPADGPFYYLDTLTPASTCTYVDTNCASAPTYPVGACRIPGVLHIVPTYCEGWVHYPDVGGTIGEVIVIPGQWSQPPGMPGVLVPNPGATFDHSIANGAFSHFEVDLLHELGHSLGLGHPDDGADWATICPGVPAGTSVPNGTGCSPMAPETGFAVELYTYDDTVGLRSLYGVRDLPTTAWRERLNPNGAWVALGFNGATFDGTGYMAAATNPGAYMTIGSHHRGAAFPVVWDWLWGPLTVTFLGAANFYVSTGPFAATDSRTAGGALARSIVTLPPRLAADARRWRRRLAVATRAVVSPSSWSTVLSAPAAATVADTSVAGVASARDPVSGMLIHAYRDNNGLVLLQSSSPSGVFSSVFQTRRMRS